MPVSVNIGGTWQAVQNIWVNIGGTWQQVQKGWANIGGTWQQFYANATVPVITQQPTNQYISVNQQATFTIAATATPSPSYQWYMNGVAISGATGSSYTTPVQPAGGSDNFYCIVSTAAGSVQSNTVTMNVFAPVKHTYTTAGTYTETIPVGAKSLYMEVGGSGGGGDVGYGAVGNPIHGGGGGAGGFCSRTIAVSQSNWGQTFTVSVGAAGAAQSNAQGSSAAGMGGLINMLANGGTGAPNSATLGTGGTSAGGSLNDTGSNGDAYGQAGRGGVGIIGGLINAGNGGNSPGINPNPGQPGTVGGVGFSYT
jgi:hypothetical protein